MSPAEYKRCAGCDTTFKWVKSPKQRHCEECSPMHVPKSAKRGPKKNPLREEYRKLKALGIIDTDAILTKNGGRCHICNNTIDRTLKFPDYWSGTIDHVMALSEGGTNDDCNLLPAHYKCNTDRHMPNVLK